MKVLIELAKYLENKAAYVPDFKLYIYGNGHDDEYGLPCDEFELCIKNRNTLQLEVHAKDLSLIITRSNAYMLQEVIKERLSLIGDPKQMMDDMLKQVENSMDNIKAIVNEYSSEESKDAYYELMTLKSKANEIANNWQTMGPYKIFNIKTIDIPEINGSITMTMSLDKTDIAGPVGIFFDVEYGKSNKLHWSSSIGCKELDENDLVNKHIYISAMKAARRLINEVSANDYALLKRAINGDIFVTVDKNDPKIKEMAQMIYDMIKKLRDTIDSPYAVTLVDTGDFSVDVIQTTVLQIKLDWLSDNFYQTDTVNDVAVKICSLLNDSKTTVQTIDKINKQIFSFMYGVPYPQSVTV